MDGARGAREKNLTFSRNRSGAAMYPGTGRLSKCAWSIVRRRRGVVLTVEGNKYVTDGRHGFGGLTS